MNTEIGNEIGVLVFVLRSRRQFTVRLPDYVFDALKKRADEERRTPSNMIRVILETHLDDGQCDRSGDRAPEL